MNVIVRISALVYPTEIEEKVSTAITNLFPVIIQKQDFGTPRLYVEGDIESLRRLHRLLREEQVLDTARHILLSGIEGNATQFRLNKQVAFVGKLNFPSGEESLGSIYVELCADNEKDLMKIIDWLAPETVEGEPVVEIEL